MLKPTPTPTDGYKKRATWEDVQRERARQVKERLEVQPFAGPNIDVGVGNRVRWNGREMVWNPAGSATAVTSGSFSGVTWNANTASGTTFEIR